MLVIVSNLLRIVISIHKFFSHIHTNRHTRKYKKIKISAHDMGIILYYLEIIYHSISVFFWNIFHFCFFSAFAVYFSFLLGNFLFKHSYEWNMWGIHVRFFTYYYCEVHVNNRFCVVFVFLYSEEPYNTIYKAAVVVMKRICSHRYEYAYIYECCNAVAASQIYKWYKTT